MDLVLLIYLVDAVAPNIKVISTVGLIVPSLFGVFLLLYYAIEDVTEGSVQWSERTTLVTKFNCCVFAFSLALSFLPSKDTAYKMLAAYGVQELAEMERAKEAGSKAYKTINKILDEYLEEGSNER